MPHLLDELDGVISRLGLADERFAIHMTGCPNGCARPYNCDVGLVGRGASKNPDGTPGPGTYTIFLGGSTLGDRLNRLWKDHVRLDEIVSELTPLFTKFRDDRRQGESFGDFCERAIELGGRADTVEHG